MAITIKELRTEFTAEIGKLQAGVTKVKTLYGQLSADTTGVKTATDKASTSMGGMQNVVQNLMSRAGLGGLASISAPYPSLRR